MLQKFTMDSNQTVFVIVDKKEEGKVKGKSYCKC